ncbi:MAG TPA: DUF1736 domain-containing protein [Candidatus Sulfotelmatobacter sp.]|nr:DUF1736 domain-containing protein [Candidatus Sulfotelmatobacter sp.]
MNQRVRVALLLLAVMIVYANTLPNDFALDDNLYIFQNPTVTHFSLGGLFLPNIKSNVFRPVTFVSLWLNWEVAGHHAWVYHLFNLLAHAVVTLLLYLVLRKLLIRLANGETLAWVAALLFAVHPIHTDAVASVIGRSELLAAGFLFAAWIFHHDDRAVLSLLCFALALFSKESALAFLPLAFLGDYLSGKLKSLYRYGLIAGVACLYIALLWTIQGHRFGQKAVPFTENPLAYLPANLRILNAVRVAWKYVWLQLYPATLSCDYSFNSIPLYAIPRHTLPALLAALLVLALWVWAFLTKRFAWFLAGGLYLAAFAITSNVLVPTGTILGERLAYLPSAGFCLLCALLWAWVHKHRRKVAWIGLAILVLALSARTIVRNRDWRDNFTLFLAAEKAVPENASIHDGLAGAYEQRGEHDAAQAETEATIAIYPDFPETLPSQGISEPDFRLVNVAVELMKHGEDKDALEFLNLAIDRAPSFSLAWSTRAVALYRRGALTSARADAECALRLDPSNTQALYILGLLSAPPKQ